MKRVLITGILAASVVVGGISWLASRSVNVYTFNINPPAWHAGSEWHLGTAPNWIGFEEFTEDSVADTAIRDKKPISTTFTYVYLGVHPYRFRAKAWQLGLVSAVVVTVISWLAIAGWDGFRDRFSSSAPRIEPPKD
jgi:hypothetical protein